MIVKQSVSEMSFRHLRIQAVFVFALKNNEKSLCSFADEEILFDIHAYFV